MTEGSTGVSRDFAEFVRKNWRSDQSAEASTYLDKAIANLSRLHHGSTTGRFLRMLQAQLDPDEFISLPISAAGILRGDRVEFPSENRRKQEEIQQQQQQAEAAAARARQEARRRRQEAIRRRRVELALRADERRREEERAAAEAKRAAELQQEVAEEREKAEALRRDREQLRRQTQRLNAHRRGLDGRIFEGLTKDFLQFDQHIATNWRSLQQVVHGFKRQKAKFVSNWADSRYELSLDSEQAAAVGAVNGDVLVTARAGSGKTRVLTARTLFLHKHCGVPVHRIMLLAFNRRAAAEMESRLREWLGDNIPHVMTFHALAYALVHPSQKLLFDDRNEGKQHLSEVTQRVIDELVTDSDWSNRIRALMLEHFRADWNRINTVGYNLSGEEFLKFRYSLQHETLKGERVSNFGQKAIANLLAEHGVDYSLGVRIPWGRRRLFADFAIGHGTLSGLYLHFADSESDEEQPDRQALKDAMASGKFKGTLLEYDVQLLKKLGEDGFRQRLLDDLRQQGLQPRLLDPDELWHAVKDRAVDMFTSAMVSFIGRCRQRAWSADDLVQHATWRKAYHDVDDYEIEFYRIGHEVYKRCMDRLGSDNLEDFNGVMLRAAETVKGGNTRFERKGNAGDIRDIHYLHIDEYQDFSRSFHDLTSAMREMNPDMNVFTVGDDWQAINGFAGADLAYFQNFEDHFADAQRLSVTRNYRSCKAVVSASNALLNPEDEPAKVVSEGEGSVHICDLAGFTPTKIELQSMHPDKPTADADRTAGYHIAVTRIAQRLAKEGDVAFLNRTRDPDVLVGANPQTAQKALRDLLAAELRERVAVDTAHSYKGLERDSVVILDAVANHYPLIHPHWIFGQIFGDTLESLEAAELRLFYVAVSRAKKHLIICTQGAKRSPFLVKVQASCGFPSLDPGSLPPIESVDSRCYEVRVFQSFHVKDLLKNDGFTYEDAGDGRGRYWCKVVARKSVTKNWIDKAPWNDGTVRIELHDGSGTRIWPPADDAVKSTAGTSASPIIDDDPF